MADVALALSMMLDVSVNDFWIASDREDILTVLVGRRNIGTQLVHDGGRNAATAT